MVLNGILLMKYGDKKVNSSHFISCQRWGYFVSLSRMLHSLFFKEYTWACKSTQLFNFHLLEVDLWLLLIHQSFKILPDLPSVLVRRNNSSPDLSQIFNKNHVFFQCFQIWKLMKILLCYTVLIDCYLADKYHYSFHMFFSNVDIICWRYQRLAISTLCSTLQYTYQFIFKI